MLKLDFNKYKPDFKSEFSSYILKGESFLDINHHSSTIVKKLRLLRKFLKKSISYSNEDSSNIKEYYRFTQFIRKKLNYFLICNIQELHDFKSLLDKNFNNVISNFERVSNLKKRKKFKLEKLKDLSEENIRDFIEQADEYIYDIYNKIFVKDGYETRINKIAYYLVELLCVSTCPYCNINETFVMKYNKIRPQLDHFFPKSKYPFFAISLGNIIPSCYTCNKKKGNFFNEGLKSPFEINSFEDFKFTFIPDIELKALTEIKLKEIEENIKSIEFIKEIRANNEVFSLRDRYQIHKDIVAEIIQKTRLVNYHKEKMDSNVLGFDFPSSEEEYRLIYCNYYPIDDEEFLKRPLSKLTFDIYKELTSTP